MSERFVRQRFLTDIDTISGLRLIGAVRVEACHAFEKEIFQIHVAVISRQRIISREFSVSEQHHGDLGVERELANLQANAAEEMASEDSSPAADAAPKAEKVAEGDDKTAEEAKLTKAQATAGLAKLVEERVTERDQDREEAAKVTVAENEEGEGQAEAEGAAAGEAAQLADIADIIDGLDVLSQSYDRETAPTEGENALGNDEGSSEGVILGVLALGLIGAGIAIAAGGSDNDDVDFEPAPPPPPPPPPPANTAPDADDDTATVNEGEAITGDLSENDSDADGDTLTYELDAPVAGLTVNADGTYSFDADDPAYDGLAAGETQDVTATINVSDGNGGTTTSTLTITVTGANDAPVAADDTNTVTEGATITGDVSANDSDADGDDLTYALAAPVAGLTVNADGTYSFDADDPAYDGLAAGETQDVTATINVSDGNGGTTTSTLTITVTGANDAPVAADDTNTVTEGATITGDVSANDSDADGDDLTYALAAPIAGLTLNADGTYSFDADDPAYDGLAAGETQDVTATINVSDGNGGTTTSTLTITVTGANDAPVAADDTNTVTEGATITGDVSANDSDADGDDLTYALAAPIAGLTLNADGTYSFDADDPAYNGLAAGETQDVTATINVSDGNGGTTTSTLTITVTGASEIVDLDVDSDGNIATVESFSGDGNDFIFTDSATEENNAEITDFGDDDIIQVDAPTSSYAFTTSNDGSSTLDDLIITTNNGGTVSRIVIQDFIPAGAFVNSEASAEAAVGRDFFTSTAAAVDPTEVSLDVDSDGNVSTAEQFDASNDAVIFSDSADIASNAEINGFGAGDSIQASGDAGDYSFTSVNDGSSTLDDIVITINNNGVVSRIVLEDVGNPNAFVTDEASAEAAVGFDFFTAGVDVSAPPPVSSGTASLDTDPDGNLSTAETIDASTAAFTFSDDVNVASNVVLQNVSADDVLEILNGDPSSFDFTSQGNDLVVTFNNNGTVNRIVIEDAVSENAFITDEASAEQALGNQLNNGVPLDFFQAG